VCFVDLKGSATSSQGILGYISVVAAVKFTYFLIKEMTFFFKYLGTSLLGCVFISYDR